MHHLTFCQIYSRLKRATRVHVLVYNESYRKNYAQNY